MREFFLYETELANQTGFKLFGFCHFMWLFGILIFIWLTGKWYVKLRKEQQTKIKYFLGMVFVVVALYRDIVLLLTGHFNVGFLPLHLCGMALWIAVCYVWTGNRFLGVVYILLCIPGAVGALLFPDWTVYPFFNYMHIHAFISHGLVVMFGLWLFWSGELVPKWKELWMPLVFGVVGFFGIYPINHWLGTNYWFVNFPSAGSPLVWIFEVTGRKWYLFGYFAFCTIVMTGWQSVLYLMERRRNRR